MTQEHLDAQGTDFASAVQTPSSSTPSSVLVGQNILKDVEWLGLVRGTDFADMVDLSALLRCWNSRFNSYSYFSQDHYAGVWLGNARTEADAHDAFATPSWRCGSSARRRRCAESGGGGGDGGKVIAVKPKRELRRAQPDVCSAAWAPQDVQVRRGFS